MRDLRPAGTRPWRLIAVLCAAQVLVQIGAFFWPTLIPRLSPLWGLSNSETGWITAIFYGAYMLSVPVLVTLTDRVDPKRIYLLGVALTVAGHFLFATYADGFWSALAMRALTGIGWAGTYMTGLKLLADRVDPETMSRATASHAASIGISGALSFAVGDTLAAGLGWQAAFYCAAGSAAVSWCLIAIFVPRRDEPVRPVEQRQALFDFRPVLRNRSAMAYAFAYGMHTLEMNALRGWAVVFLGFVAASTGVTDAWITPAILVTALSLVGTVASIGGNETAIRFGRRRLVTIAIGGSILIALATGIFGPLSYELAALLLFLYGFFIWLDSSSLTAGTAGTAEPSRRGATLAVHSMLGYGGGFIGPLLIGWTLDLSGGMTRTGWAVAFAAIAACTTIALVVFRVIRPAEIAGDRQAR